MMNINDYMMPDKNEKPLDRLVNDGGLCGIFRNICCIGDSLSSGEFEAEDRDGNKSYHDMFKYSWGQFLARDAGCEVLNFSRGGMSAKEYIESFAEQNGFWDEEKLCQAYIIALGVNDLYGLKQPVGSIEDVDFDDFTNNNTETFAGCYGTIIQRIKKMQPKARFFLMTMPHSADESDEKKQEHAKLLHEFAEKFEFTYVLDFHKYAPVYDREFMKKFYLHGHLNPVGYRLTAKMVESYIDYIIRREPEKFAQVPFIGTEYYDERLD